MGVAHLRGIGALSDPRSWGVVDMDLNTISLRLAFLEPGCPLCRLGQQAERRYLFTLLYENVNDGGTRRRLARSLGFCAQHAWALQATEQERWRDGLGVGIIYEDLSRQVQRSLKEYLTRNPLAQAERRARLRKNLGRMGAVGRWLAGRLSPLAGKASLLPSLSPRESCRVCEFVGEMEEITLNWLVQGLEKAEFRDLYAASDGLCLPHLRRALARTQGDQAAHCLAEVAAAQLDSLVADLGEYIRKHDWNNREEPKHPGEQISWIRAVAFFAGEAPQSEREDVYRLRREAVTEYHRREEERIL